MQKEATVDDKQCSENLFLALTPWSTGLIAISRLILARQFLLYGFGRNKGSEGQKGSDQIK